MTSDLKTALAAADKACHIISNAYGKSVQTEQKSDHSLVTAVDRQAERVIIDTLQKNSKHAILSEESGSLPGNTGFTWIIDPIDGTTNFARHHLPFAVSIALMHGDDSVLGVIQNPLTKQVFYAEKTRGAFLDGQPIHVSQNADPYQSILFFNFGAHPDDRQKIVRVVDQFIYDFDLRTWGTTAWELCAVAKGAVDAFICVGDKIWDFAAGMCIVEQAGGRFTDWRGLPWNSSHSYVLASNPQMQSLIIEKIHQI
jgi:myo-inositol-1(or 4)-monophosphatase